MRTIDCDSEPSHESLRIHSHREHGHRALDLTNVELQVSEARHVIGDERVSDELLRKIEDPAHLHLNANTIDQLIDQLRDHGLPASWLAALEEHGELRICFLGTVYYYPSVYDDEQGRDEFVHCLFLTSSKRSPKFSDVFPAPQATWKKGYAPLRFKGNGQPSWFRDAA